MNTYISRTKAVITDYLMKARKTAEKIKAGRDIYQPEAMEKEEERLNNELFNARLDAENRIQNIYKEATAGAKEWGQLDGKKLTADAELLKGEGVTPEQFSELVERYQDNYTMLDRLRKYGEARNAEAMKQANEKGKVALASPYNVRDIPGPDHKFKEWDAMLKQAEHYLNCADGTGFASDFERAFAQEVANSENGFEAWGKET